jgi:hypothetical protein
MVSKAVEAAVGGLVIQATFLEFLPAWLVRLAGDTDNEMALLAPQPGRRCRTPTFGSGPWTG